MVDREQLQMTYEQQMRMTQALHDHQVQMVLLSFGPMFAFMIIMIVSVSWLANRPKMRMIEVLKAYAEKGQEPPPGVVEAIGKIRAPAFAPPQPPRRQTRADHLAHFAGSLVLAFGAAGLAWWRLAYGDPSSPLPIIAMVVAIFFFASAAARLVGALTTNDDGGR